MVTRKSMILATLAAALIGPLLFGQTSQPGGEKDAKKPSPADLLTQAKEKLESGEAQEAVELADKCLADPAKPKPADRVEAKRVRLDGLLHLADETIRRTQGFYGDAAEKSAARKTLPRILLRVGDVLAKEGPQFSKSDQAEFYMRLGRLKEAAEAALHRPSTDAYPRRQAARLLLIVPDFQRAADLYIAAGKKRQAAAALSQVARVTFVAGELPESAGTTQPETQPANLPVTFGGGRTGTTILGGGSSFFGGGSLIDNPANARCRQAILQTLDRIIALNVNDSTNLETLVAKAMATKASFNGTPTWMPTGEFFVAGSDLPNFEGIAHEGTASRDDPPGFVSPARAAIGMTNPDDLDRLIRDKYTNTRFGPPAAMRLADSLNMWGEPKEALQAYQFVLDHSSSPTTQPSKPTRSRNSLFAEDDAPVTYDGTEAQKKIDAIRAPVLEFNWPQTARPFEETKINWKVRNLRHVRFRAWAVDMPDVLGKPEYGNLDNVKIPGNKIVADWTVTTPDTGDFRTFVSDDSFGWSSQTGGNRVEPVVFGGNSTQSGAYLIRASARSADGERVEETHLLLVTRLALICKTWGNEGFILAVGAETGQPIGRATLSLREQGPSKTLFREPGEQKFTNGRSDADGFWPLKAKIADGTADLFARDGSDWAVIRNLWQTTDNSDRDIGTDETSIFGQPTTAPAEVEDDDSFFRNHRSGGGIGSTIFGGGGTGATIFGGGHSIFGGGSPNARPANLPAPAPSTQPWAASQPDVDITAYGFTNRPLYRPGDTVHFKQIVRSENDRAQSTTSRRYSIVPGRRIAVATMSPNGDMIGMQRLTCDAASTICGDFQLPADAPLGEYRILTRATTRPCDNLPEITFRVEEFKKPEFEVTIKSARPAYRLGEKVKVEVRANYYFGGPVVGAKVQWAARSEPCWPYALTTDAPWRMRLRAATGVDPTGVTGWSDMSNNFEGEGTTDEHGKFIIELDTKVPTTSPARQGEAERSPDGQPMAVPAGADLSFSINAKVTDSARRTITGDGTVRVTRQPVLILIAPEHSVCKPDQPVTIHGIARGPNGDPVRLAGKVKVFAVAHKKVHDKETDTDVFRESLGDSVASGDVTFDERGAMDWKLNLNLNLKLPLEKEGCFKVVVTAGLRHGEVPANRDEAGADRDTAVGETYLWVVDNATTADLFNYPDLEVVLDRREYHPGDTARVLINCRYQNATVLLTEEADGLLNKRLIHLTDKSQVVLVKIEARHAPDFHVIATMVHDGQCFEAGDRVTVPVVDKRLNVTLANPSRTFRPRDKADLLLKVTDAAGEPVQTDLSVSLFDKSLAYIEASGRRPIYAEFYSPLWPRQRIQNNTSANLADTRYPEYYNETTEDFLPTDYVGMQWPVATAASRLVPVRPGEVMESVTGSTAAGGGAVWTPKQFFIRKDFRDSALWAAHARSGADGVARVATTLPDSLTTWTLGAVAADDRTRVGELADELVTKKDVIVRLNAPRFFVDGDRVWLAVEAHNYLDKPKKVKVTLKADGPLALIGIASPADLRMHPATSQPAISVETELPPGGSRRIDFASVATGVGAIMLTASAETDAESDAMQIETQSIAYGIPIVVARSGSLRGKQDDQVQLEFDVPANSPPASRQLTIQLSPSTATVAIEAMPYLIAYPYGCVEQTMSRFLPAVVVRRTLGKLGVSMPQVQRLIEKERSATGRNRFVGRYDMNPVFDPEKLDSVIDAGVKRLMSMRHEDGGWGWWASDKSQAHMTAYVVYGLAEAREAGVQVSDRAIAGAVSWLREQLINGRLDENTSDWALMAISVAQPSRLKDDADLIASLKAAFDERKKLSDYGRALLAIALSNAGDDFKPSAAAVVKELVSSAVRDKAAPTAAWGLKRADRWSSWSDDPVETTAWVVRAMIAIDPKNELIPQAVHWLVSSRQGTQWQSTRDTAMAVYALADFMQAGDELRPDLSANVELDARPVGQVRVTPENMFSFVGKFTVDAKSLSPGRHVVRVTRQDRAAKGGIDVSVCLECVSTTQPVATGTGLTIERQYFRVTRKDVGDAAEPDPRRDGVSEDDGDRAAAGELLTPLPGNATVSSGDEIEVRLTVKLDEYQEYLFFEDPKPAGCEPVELRSGERQAAGGAAGWQTVFANVELRDQKVAFFATDLQAGEHRMSYRLRCEIPGDYRVLPAKGGSMYSPHVRANSPPATIHIRDGNTDPLKPAKAGGPGG